MKMEPINASFCTLYRVLMGVCIPPSHLTWWNQDAGGTYRLVLRGLRVRHSARVAEVTDIAKVSAVVGVEMTNNTQIIVLLHLLLLCCVNKTFMFTTFVDGLM